MNNSSLVELLKTLSADELRGFSEYLSLAYYNREKHWKESRVLLEMMARHAPGYDSPELEREAVCRHLFPGLPFSEARLRKVMAKLYKSLRAFLLHEEYRREDNQMAAQIDFARLLNRRKLSRKAASLLQSTKTELVGREPKSKDDFNLLFQTTLLQGQIESFRSSTWRQSFHLDEVMRWLDLYFFHYRVGLLNSSLLLAKHAKIDIGFDLEAQRRLVDWLDVGHAELPPALQLLKKMFEFYTLPYDPQLVGPFFEQLRALRDKIARDDLALIYVLLKNHCVILINNGFTELWGTLFQIQRANLDDGFLYVNDLIPPGSFINLTTQGLMANEPDWVIEFINAHRDRVMGDNDLRDYYRLAMACYHDHQKDFDRALDFIPPASANLSWHLHARRLELKIYYETNSDLLPYKLDTFKMYLSRNHKGLLSEETYRMNANFLNILVQLAQSKPGDKNRRATILKRIEEKTPIISKHWLIEKAMELP